MSEVQAEVAAVQDNKSVAQNGNRVTTDSINAKIKGITTYPLVGTTITIAVITMENGFTVTGESACADPANFDLEIGKENAVNNAYDKIWMLEGYLLKERLFRDGLAKSEGVGIAELIKTSKALNQAAAELADLKSVEHIAKTCHEINRAYCQAIGDNSQPAWEEAPEWQRASAIKGVQFHIANPDADPAASHQSWYDQKAAEGWSFGLVKNEELKMHPCMVPYNMLPVEQKAKDYLFRATVHQLAA